MKLIQTQDYLLFIDEGAEIKEYFKGYVYQPHWKKPVQLEDNFISLGYAEEDRKDFGGGRIIAYRKLNKEAKELDLPLLPPFEVDIEKLACEKYNIKDGINDYDERYYNSHNVAKAEAFIAGYKAAQSKQFSLEDMKKALSEAFKASQEGYQITADEIIQSLSTQQLPKEFKPIMVCGRCLKPDDDDEDCWSAKECSRNTDFPDRFKTITNSEGKQELVGVYKY